MRFTRGERLYLAVTLGAGGPAVFATVALLTIFAAIPPDPAATAAVPAGGATSAPATFAPSGKGTLPPTPTRPGPDTVARRATIVHATRTVTAAPTGRSPAPTTTVTVTVTPSSTPTPSEQADAPPGEGVVRSGGASVEERP